MSEILGYFLMFWWIFPLIWFLLPVKCICGDRWFRITDEYWETITCLKCGETWQVDYQIQERKKWRKY